jgi:hypothetical protein
MNVEAEADLDARTAKWKAASYDMLRDLLSMKKKVIPTITILQLFGELRIRPELVGWNDEEKDFTV